MVVLFEPARSADPPHSSGTTPARAESTLPDAARVANDSPTSQVGRASSRPSGRRWASRRSNSAAPAGLACCQVEKRASQSARAARALSAACFRAWETTSSGRMKLCSGSRPRARLSPATSSAPSLEPWEDSWPCLVGEGQAMMVCRRISDGRALSARAATMASCSASRFSA